MGKKNPLHNGMLVCVNERWQVAYWTTALQCSAEELRAAVEVVGDNLGKVRVHLRNNARVAEPAA